MVEYFSTTRWDGAVDLSWYNGTDTEFTLTTPAAGGCGRAGEQQYHRLRRQDHPPRRTSPCCGMRRRASPGEPSQPTQPEKPTTPDAPATGDSSNVTALWVVLAVAGVGIIVLVVLLVTKRKNKKD